MKKLNYRTLEPSGKCAICGINLWAEHGNKPAPHTYPCLINNCAHPSDAKVLTFDRSLTGCGLSYTTYEGS